MSSISINDVMALRNAVLDKNAALRNIASNPNSVAVSAAARGAAFDAAMNTALGTVDSPNSVSGVSGAAGVSFKPCCSAVKPVQARAPTRIVSRRKRLCLSLSLILPGLVLTLYC